MSHVVDRKTENYMKLFFCKVPSESKKRGSLKSGAFLFAFSILKDKSSDSVVSPFSLL